MPGLFACRMPAPCMRCGAELRLANNQQPLPPCQPASSHATQQTPQARAHCRSTEQQGPGIGSPSWNCWPGREASASRSTAGLRATGVPPAPPAPCCCSAAAARERNSVRSAAATGLRLVTPSSQDSTWTGQGRRWGAACGEMGCTALLLMEQRQLHLVTAMRTAHGPQSAAKRACSA